MIEYVIVCRSCKETKDPVAFQDDEATRCNDCIRARGIGTSVSPRRYSMKCGATTRHLYRKRNGISDELIHPVEPSHWPLATMETIFETLV